MSTFLRTTTHLTLMLAVAFATAMTSMRTRLDEGVERSKDDAGAISLETILVAVGLAAGAAVVVGLIAAAISAAGSRL